MKVLVTTSHGSLYQHPDPDGSPLHRNLGRLVQPRHYPRVEDTAAAGIPWAADNDCFQGLDAPAFYAMCDRLQGLPGCLFVTVPDVVADARATAEQFERWAPGLERRGLPVALVLQDGIHHPALQRWLARSWHRIDALFIGGSTEFKLGPVAADLVRRGLADGKHVHWGRVNTRRRFDYCAAVGGHTFDGSSFARWRHTLLNDALAWTLEEPGELTPHWQLSLEGAA